MADLKISELATESPLVGTELVELVTGGVNKKTTTQDIADLGGGGGHVIEEEGTPLTQRTKLNFVGAGVTVTDDSGDDASVVTIPASISDTAYDATSWNGVTDIAPSKNAVRDELELKAYLDSPTFTGTPAAPTAAVGTSTTQIATTAFVQGEVGFTTVSVTGGTTLDSTAFGKMHVCTGTTVNYTINLPTAVGNAGKSIAFKGSSALTKNVTIDGDSGETIDGDATREFNANGLLVLLSDGSNWALVAEVGSWVNYTPVWTGFSADPTVVASKYFRVGKMCRIKIRTSANGTSNATTKTVTFPFNASAVTDFALIAMVANNGAVTATPGLLITRANNNIVDLYRDTSTAAWTASAGCRMNIDCTYETE